MHNTKQQKQIYDYYVFGQGMQEKKRRDKQKQKLNKKFVVQFTSLLQQIDDIIGQGEQDHVNLKTFIEVLQINQNTEETLQLHYLKEILKRSNQKIWSSRELAEEIKSMLQKDTMKGKNIKRWWGNFQSVFEGDKSSFDVNTLIAQTEKINRKLSEQELNLFKSRPLWTKNELFRALDCE